MENKRIQDALIGWTFAFLLGIAVAIVVLGTHSTQAQQPDKRIGGNYEIVSGRYPFVFDGGVREHAGVFRIEKDTGKSWRFFSSFQNGKSVDQWEPISE